MKIPEVEQPKLSEQSVTLVGNDATPKSIIEEIVRSGNQEDAFYVMDVGDVAKKHEIWSENLPNVKPFYAVKCNDSKLVLNLLASLGTGFDCASKGEIARVLSLGVPPERIIYANPTKPASHIRYAAKVGVDLMTFDNVSELLKIKELHPRAKLMLRIRADAADAQCPLGMKFGADIANVPELITLAAEIDADLVGVSFHVGSGCRDLTAFASSVRIGINVLEQMVYKGFQPAILDIGGGFTTETFAKASSLITEALEILSPQIAVIAEPGRFFVESAYTLATTIHGRRRNEYYINDGVYGSFNCVLYDHYVPVPTALQTSDGELQHFKIWGPTCDSLDLVTEEALLPNLDVGDWLVWEKMGAYTVAAASNFNGFPVPKVHHVASLNLWKELAKHPGLSGLLTTDENTKILA